MGKPNLDSGRLTLQLSPEAKAKAYERATEKKMSIKQYLEMLIDDAVSTGTESSLTSQFAELKEKTADLEKTMGQIQEQLSTRRKR